MSTISSGCSVPMLMKRAYTTALRPLLPEDHVYQWLIIHGRASLPETWSWETEMWKVFGLGNGPSLVAILPNAGVLVSCSVSTQYPLVLAKPQFTLDQEQLNTVIAISEPNTLGEPLGMGARDRSNENNKNKLNMPSAIGIFESNCRSIHHFVDLKSTLEMKPHYFWYCICDYLSEYDLHTIHSTTVIAVVEIFRSSWFSEFSPSGLMFGNCSYCGSSSYRGRVFTLFWWRRRMGCCLMLGCCEHGVLLRHRYTDFRGREGCHLLESEWKVGREVLVEQEPAGRCLTVLWLQYQGSAHLGRQGEQPRDHLNLTDGRQLDQPRCRLRQTPCQKRRSCKWRGGRYNTHQLGRWVVSRIQTDGCCPPTEIGANRISEPYYLKDDPLNSKGNSHYGCNDICIVAYGLSSLQTYVTIELFSASNFSIWYVAVTVQNPSTSVLLTNRINVVRLPACSIHSLQPYDVTSSFEAAEPQSYQPQEKGSLTVAARRGYTEEIEGDLKTTAIQPTDQDEVLQTAEFYAIVTPNRDLKQHSRRDGQSGLKTG
ncbi:uncharacterized protein BDR25DRAFT_353126 [Lindgomyces ingoldianus]|uniref:Uncharacterized protein n=1 Tax=Lindgomyces ingoldianus TaxID=673940 RepID=A0ACB6R0G7_9PLEO|nr:uncharacterized protein BDR25DRAFT_353126 [Lindgomyces ingoldianus]KAF2472804.1 hypothetical protein BDR25DRAFT_353126 [Lindgomyces ingoldianus]